MNRLGLRITNNGREAYVANPNHEWELHTVDFNACLLTLDNIDEGEGLLILSHGSGGCYVGFVHLLKQGFNGVCIAASIFVPENLSVDGNAMRHLIGEVRQQLRGTMLDTAALDRLFATEYPDKDYVPPFEPQHGTTIACRIEEWTDDTLQLLLDSRCLFQPAYAPHRAVLLIDAQSGIVCNGINISDVPVVIPEPEPEPEQEIIETPEPEMVEKLESEILEESEPEVLDQSEVEVVVAEAPKQEDGELEVEVLDGPEPVVDIVPEVPMVEAKLDKETLEESIKQEVEKAGDNDSGVEVIAVYPMPPIPPMPPMDNNGGASYATDGAPSFGLPEFPVNNSPQNSPDDGVTIVNSKPENVATENPGKDFASGSNKLMMFLLFLLVGILLLFIVSVSMDGKSDSASSIDNTADSTSVATVYEPEEVSAIEENVNLNQLIYDAYVDKLNSLATAYYDDFLGYSQCDYFLYDITGDGKPELWVKCGSCEADYMLYVYRYDVNGLSLMYKTSAGHSSFYCGDDYVIQMMAHMGCNWWYRYTLSGSTLDEETVFEESDVADSFEYTYPDEPEVDMYDYETTWPISIALGL